ncbi:SgcJ/EcaC family oxidoreductase [Mesorhizobium sp. CA18]|nr:MULTISPECIES: SgcJ/EcaC family oxidoreductase [unclassified Mesorhizobium]MBZ9736532.1 SgcJ/EcaC family oxidoreductase [Mesorhizobium sp. CA9]MBZ9827254.1 SgcJ/EcaC family oxidoreductase [Mesorhizobium sp. CA18]MBZ9832721.1 SgcJ/EcaC family oxidoreductase [Mesorhizobium sp. CA2]MBZ9838998.1 SgcJ/EcaC family oxidoreductase [Mesorhizobium sp. CA3]MBZ9879451.1 SgcJ/EcaC family oxidoreductase [Mesorhizobium sp. Ca11]
MTDDATAIRQVVETWMAASRKGDLETVLGLMTDDVVFMVPGKEPFGKEAFAGPPGTWARRRSTVTARS